MEKINIQQPEGKLGVLVVGISGAVSSTFIAGTFSVRKQLSRPIGSITQMATIRLGQRNENRFPKIKDVVPLASLDELVFGGWDIHDENLYESSLYAEVLEKDHLAPIKEELEQIRPMTAVFDQNYVKRLHGTHVKSGESKWDMVKQVRQDIRDFKAKNGCDRVVVIWCGSTEVFLPASDIHKDLATFEKAMKENHADIAPSMIYAYAAIAEDVPYINGAPNLTVDFPAMRQHAENHNVPICGKDFKTGQTMLKTVLAPMFKTRMLGLNGWFSTNILGNRDGEVLDDPGSFKTKEESKLSVINTILQPELYPELYKEVYHKVRINYYPPRKDNKEGWDNIDLFGWMGYPMQMKVDFLCRDSILAAPLCLDLVLLTDLAKRCGFSGIQHWLSFYFKSPMHEENQMPEHDLFIQSVKLKNTLRMVINEKPVDFLDETIELFR
ncbi:MAG: inositol-3-phosphate synthase [Prevotellaceae bacterium]|jgi:myo-inositol-1-phosphate synthase|nr:inositol-3-phosphate synthase [Prevotellaceae bacterium]